jgi:glycine/D-amino acid oxidase-like deaminating enzyme
VRADVLIAGQGLAGTLLAWELERVGIPFVVVDAGLGAAASRAAAGIVNPITGRRLTRSWRFDVLRPAAAAVFRELEAELGVPLWREMRLRRRWVDEGGRALAARKLAAGELAPYVASADAAGIWVREAARVDLPTLLAVARARWAGQGRLREGVVDLRAAALAHALVVDCTGQATAETGAFGFVPWETSQGEVLEIAVEGLAPDVIVNDGHWIVPVCDGVAWVGATHEPGGRDARVTATAREKLTGWASGLLDGRRFSVLGQRAGVRVNVPDRRPVAGRHPEHERLGLCSGLAAKGTLWGPLLARQWAEHLAAGRCFDPEIDVRRFVHAGSGS